MKYTVNLNKKQSIILEKRDTLYLVDQMQQEYDKVLLPDGSLHYLYKNRSYCVEVVSMSKVDKAFQIKVNGNIYSVSVRDEYDALLKQLGMENLSSIAIKEIKAPMPGLVLRTLVKAGDVVKKGDPILVLEAMKMENMIKAGADATVASVCVQSGDKVEKAQVLISFKD